jgi:hypothetical protein
VFEREGVRVVCDSVSLDFLRGAVLEYEDSLMRSAFQVRLAQHLSVPSAPGAIWCQEENTQLALPHALSVPGAGRACLGSTC